MGGFGAIEGAIYIAMFASIGLGGCVYVVYRFMCDDDRG